MNRDKLIKEGSDIYWKYKNEGMMCNHDTTMGTSPGIVMEYFNYMLSYIENHED